MMSLIGEMQLSLIFRINSLVSNIGELVIRVSTLHKIVKQVIHLPSIVQDQ